MLISQSDSRVELSISEDQNDIIEIEEWSDCIDIE